MKHVRKFLPILLVLLLALGMAGCGSSGSGDDGGADASSASGSTDTSADTGDATADPVEYQHGTIDGTVYTSDFFGFTFTAKDSWSFSDEAELRQANQSVSDILDDDAVTDALKDGQTFIDMQAADGDDPISNINLTVSYAPGSNGIDDVNDQTIEYMKKMYEGAGFSDVEITTSTAKVDGDTLDALVTKMSVQGIDFVEKQIFFVSNDYLGTLTVSGTSEDACDTLLSWVTTK